MTYIQKANRVDASALTERQLSNFWRHVTRGAGCWIWNGSKDSRGYGRLRIPRGAGTGFTGAHRFAYALAGNDLPSDLVLDHLCDTPECVRPDHMNPTTQRDNLARSSITLSGKSLKRTHFPCGHEITEEQILWEGTTRRCAPCRSAYNKVYQASYRLRSN
jgi:hypothetical protein